MKTTIRSLALFMSLALFFSACKKDKDDVKGSFTYDGQTYTTNYAINTTFDGSYSDLVLLSVDYNPNFTGKAHGVGITFDNQKVTAGTYTYKPDNDPEFDATKHFFDGYAFMNVNFPNLDTGTWREDIVSGTATVSVSGSTMTVTYELVFGDDKKKVTGSFSGTVKQVDED
jgi:hypothetical protein